MLAISVFSALADAVAAVGGHRLSPSLDAPATPERVLLAVEELRAASRSRRSGRPPNDRSGCQALTELAAAERPAVLVTILHVAGSTPREAGTKMVVSEDALHGTIGGGHLELAAIELARELLAAAGDGGRPRLASGARVPARAEPGPVLRRRREAPLRDGPAGELARRRSSARATWGRRS